MPRVATPGSVCEVMMMAEGDENVLRICRFSKVLASARWRRKITREDMWLPGPGCMILPLIGSSEAGACWRLHNPSPGSELCSPSAGLSEAMLLSKRNTSTFKNPSLKLNPHLDFKYSMEI